ncbi:MAG: uroporphyrinogen decarboxylase family protein [Nitrospirae bacterium]|nr:uroporphyrinogen decarboxylase family protein [Nitrospirota bacterium]
MEKDIAPKNWKRINTALAFEEPDQVPFFLNVNGPYIAGFAKVELKEYYHSPEIMLNAQLALRQRFNGLTPVMPDLSIAPEPSALGAEIKWSADGTPWVIPFIKGEEDVERLEIPDVENAGYMTKSLHTYRYMFEKVGHEIPVVFGTTHSPWGVAALMRGTSDFLADVIMNPDLVRKLLRKTTDLSLLWLRTMEKSAPPGTFRRILIWDDLASFVSLKQFREFILPVYEEIYGSFPRCERWYHNDANATNILEGIAEAAVQCFHFGYEVDIGYAKDKIGKKVCLMGNVPPLTVLRNGTPEDVYRSVKDIIERASKRGGLIVAAGGYLDEGTPETNIEAMIEATEKYGKQ